MLTVDSMNKAVGEAPSTLRHGRHGCASRGGSRRGGREAGGGGGPRGGRRGGERLHCCDMFLKVPPELLDPGGGPGGEHKECELLAIYTGLFLLYTLNLRGTIVLRP